MTTERQIAEILDPEEVQGLIEMLQRTQALKLSDSTPPDAELSDLLRTIREPDSSKPHMLGASFRVASQIHTIRRGY